jgi:hypothetical protein
MGTSRFQTSLDLTPTKKLNFEVQKKPKIKVGFRQEPSVRQVSVQIGRPEVDRKRDSFNKSTIRVLNNGERRGRSPLKSSCYVTKDGKMLDKREGQRLSYATKNSLKQAMLDKNRGRGQMFDSIVEKENSPGERKEFNGSAQNYYQFVDRPFNNQHFNY